MSCHNCDCFECEEANREAALDANEVLYNQPQPYREPTWEERALKAYWLPHFRKALEPSPLLDYISK